MRQVISAIVWMLIGACIVGVIDSKREVPEIVCPEPVYIPHLEDVTMDVPAPAFNELLHALEKAGVMLKADPPKSDYMYWWPFP
jgi:hypothetical protein